MPDPNARLNVQLSAVTSNIDPGEYMELRVTDTSSRLAVCTITLHAKDVMDLISNRIVGGVEGIPAWINPPESRHALGLRMVFATQLYDCHPPRVGPTSDWWDAAHRWADEAKRLMGATTYQLIEKGGKLEATFRCYVADDNAPAFETQIRAWLSAWPGPHGTNR